MIVQYKRKSKRTPEGHIEEDVLRYLNEEAGYYAFKVPSTGIFDRSSGAYRKPSPWAVNGVSDIIACKDGRVYFVEVKTASGYQSQDQRNFETQVTKQGCTYVVVRSVEQMRKLVAEWGKGNV